MTEPGLFPEPARVDMPADGPWTVLPTGWRCQLLGEDGETVLIQSHVRNSEIPEVLVLLRTLYGIAPTDEVSPLRTWVRQLTECPTHPPAHSEHGCTWCLASPSEPWWDWSTPEDDPTAHRNTAGYFPATVIELEA